MMPDDTQTRAQQDAIDTEYTTEQPVRPGPDYVTRAELVAALEFADDPPEVAVELMRVDAARRVPDYITRAQLIRAIVDVRETIDEHTSADSALERLAYAIDPVNWDACRSACGDDEDDGTSRCPSDYDDEPPPAYVTEAVAPYGRVVRWTQLDTGCPAPNHAIALVWIEATNDKAGPTDEARIVVADLHHTEHPPRMRTVTEVVHVMANVTDDELKTIFRRTSAPEQPTMSVVAEAAEARALRERCKQLEAEVAVARESIGRLTVERDAVALALMAARKDGAA